MDDALESLGVICAGIGTGLLCFLLLHLTGVL